MSGLKWVDINNVEGVTKHSVGANPRTSWILVSEKTVGAQGIAMGVNETSVGGVVPRHKHEKEEEVMYFIQGQGKFVTETQEINLKPGICVYNPPGEYHSIVNTGDEILKFVWIYTPQLPEHRIQK